MRPVDDNWWELFDLVVVEGKLEGERVLDVGCGTGRFAAALARRGAQVWGVDPSDDMLRQARTNAGRNVGFKLGRAESLPFKDGWFGRVVMRLVIHLVARPQALAESHRVLSEGGRLLVATFAPESLEGFWPVRVFPEVAEIDRGRFPAEEELTRELEAAGFTGVHAERLVQHARLERDEALARLRARFISTLRLLDHQTFAAGLARAERELPALVEDRREWLVLTAQRG